MFVGNFEGDFNQTQVDIAAAFDQFYASGVTNLVIDVTNNGGLYGFMTEMPNNLTAVGGSLCLGLFLYQYLTTSGIP
jgi:hypothetical protein